ncbi:hypothetical protein J2D73_14735 [Acetobacter sacchari]|uniref:Uncharacterized protein n=1 Tax=Acetobacter sacchari TaxID=2661687 RepID=A0ABS3LYT8_9PROT|nr:hypothetical protein [Acetobacter sacchari]MBO1361043.1 hypothetical protein [Acetobacter sacchari]
MTSFLTPKNKKKNNNIKSIIFDFITGKELSDILSSSLKPNIIFSGALLGIVSSAYPTYHALMFSSDCGNQQLYAAASAHLRTSMALSSISLSMTVIMLAIKHCAEIIRPRNSFLRYSGLIHVIVPVSLIFSAFSFWSATTFVGSSTHTAIINSGTCPAGLLAKPTMG